jgi:hypothetical protein
VGNGIRWPNTIVNCHWPPNNILVRPKGTLLLDPS